MQNFYALLFVTELLRNQKMKWEKVKLEFFSTDFGDSYKEENKKKRHVKNEWKTEKQNRNKTTDI